MKKFKKIIAIGCAAVMAVSAMSISAFAADIKNNVNDSLAVTASDPDKPVDITLNGSYNYGEFSTTKNYAKIWVNNTSGNLGKASIIPIVDGVLQDDKAIIIIDPVKAYTDNQIYTVNLKAEFPGVTSFRVVVSGNDGFPLSGGMAVRIGNTQVLSVPDEIQ